MHRWNRTVLEWDFKTQSGLVTALPVPDHKGKVKRGESQTLYTIRAISLPERRGKIQMGMYPSISSFKHVGENHILKHFANLLESDRGVTVYRGTWDKGTWPQLTFNFELRDGESFCDTAIDLAGAILKRAGVQDERNYWLGHFTLKQDTFVKFENGWFSFVSWLRIQHQLPLTYVNDDKNIPLVGEQDLV